MKSNLIAAAVVAVSALTSVAASAETFNSYLFDQMTAPTTRTRAEVRAEVEKAPVASNGFGATAQQAQPAAHSQKTSAPAQAAADLPSAVKQ